MSKFVSGTFISIKNSLGCEIDREFVADIDGDVENMGVSEMLIDMLRNMPLNSGDSITMEDGDQQVG